MHTRKFPEAKRDSFFQSSEIGKNVALPTNLLEGLKISVRRSNVNSNLDLPIREIPKLASNYANHQENSIFQAIPSNNRSQYRNLQNLQRSSLNSSKIFKGSLNKSEQTFPKNTKDFPEQELTNIRTRKSFSLPTSKIHWNTLKNAFKCVVLLKNPPVYKISNEQSFKDDMDAYYHDRQLNMQKTRSTGGFLIRTPASGLKIASKKPSNRITSNRRKSG